VQPSTTTRKPLCTIAFFGLPQWKIQRGVPFAGTVEPGSINRSRNCRFDTAVKRAKKGRTVALVDDSIVQDTARFHRKWRIKSSCGIKGVITHKSFLNGEFAPFSRLNERRLIYHIFERVGASYCQNITAARKRQAMRYHIVKSITTALGSQVMTSNDMSAFFSMCPCPSDC
jgi:hypothetical protein